MNDQDISENTVLTQSLKRRTLLKSFGTAIAVTPVLSLIGCGGSGSSSSDSQTSADNTTSTDDSSSDDDQTVTDGSNKTEWAEGGTASMSATFPPSDPFVSGLGNLCTITAAYTLGPCYFAPDDFREDISEGQLGVPMALVLKLVDANCEPLEGVEIEVWFCNTEGLYSGDTQDSSDASSFNTGFCTDNDTQALASKWFRGVQTTDSDGNVYYKACFPGWYPSRTTHIHVKVVRDGLELLVSQFAFEDDLSNDIYVNHSDYTGSAKDTSNTTDTVFGSNVDEYLFTVERQSDNSMLAYKAIQIDV